MLELKSVRDYNIRNRTTVDYRQIMRCDSVGSQDHTSYTDRKHITAIIGTVIILVVVFAVALYTVLIRDLKAELGNKAMVLAVDITHWIGIDQQDHAYLLSLDFNTLLTDPINQAFEGKARDVMASSEIKYIYLLSALPEEKAPYRVGGDETEDYNAPAGTPLTGVYTLDAVLNEELRLSDSGPGGYTDQSRYTVIQPEVREIMESRRPGYMLNTDEWGTYLTGYAPYFAEDGTYLGMIGVDLFPDKYYAYVKRSMTMLGIFLFTLAMMGLIFTRLLLRVWKAEERIRLEKEMATQDSLTGLMNRRKFMDLLTHEYAVCRREGMPLVLMMADMEDFSRFNTSNGRAKGDCILTETAVYLGTKVKRASDALCRFGGDEFALFLHNTEAENALGFAEDLLADAPYPFSLGIVALMPQEINMPEAVLQTLDEAVRHASKTGTRKYAFVEEAS